MASSTKTLSGWAWRRYRQSNEEKWQPCAHSKPTTEIFTDLLDDGKIPDPFLDQNERLVQWVAEADWEYKCDFFHEATAGHTRQDLIFEGLDTFATVYLNERVILLSTNMFHRHRINVSDTVIEGQNTLRIVFKSALLEGRRLEREHGKLRAFNGEGSRLHVRKAAYHYGWDWGPILMSCGPYREVKLQSYASTIYDVFANATVAEDLSSATLDVSWASILDRDMEIEITVTSPTNDKFQASSTLPGSSEDGKVSIPIPRPALWYPVGYGSQPLYDIQLLLRNKDGIVAETICKSIGVRRARLLQQPLDGESGTSFFFEINNVPVYVSGSNFIPDHSFLTALSPKDYKNTVNSCIEGNQNMLRIWGGGIYEHESLYEECDRRGLLVWQDFMFACGQYPCWPGFAESVKREAADQLKRLRNYCSIVLYAGNNEDYQVIESLKLEYDPDDHSGDWTHTEFPARTIYETHLPAAMSEHSPGVAYHPSSPWGGKGTDDRTVGDIHQWNVWHGTQEPYQLWDKIIGRFVSEFGMLAYPSIKSVPRFVTDPKQRYPQSAVLELHNKAEGSERRLALYVMENLRVDSMSLEAWTYATQLIQAECLSYAVRSCRRQWKGLGREYCGGQLMWQLNDCYPVSSWGMIDFYGERKLSYYTTKRDSAPLALGISRTTPELKALKSPPEQIAGAPHDLAEKRWILDVWVVNTTLHDAEVTITLRYFDIESGTLYLKKNLERQTLESNKSTELLADSEVNSQLAVQATMMNGQGEVVTRASDWPQPLKHVTLPYAYKISLSVRDGEVEINTSAPVKCLELYMADESRQVVWADNAIDVFPADAYIVKAAGLREGDEVRMRYYGMEWAPNQQDEKAMSNGHTNGYRRAE
ncbi:glycosyl hydrolases family 2 domain-containing protein [Sarocladium implicatum]|nr:glycosyl hydrolases family 2 domain-containing protein [Sarocladium implicatum]